MRIDPCSGLIRVDGLILCKKVIRNGVTFLQFKDKDNLRSQCQGRTLIEISLVELTEVIEQAKLD